MADMNEFGLLATLLHYPEEGYAQQTERCRDAIAAKWPEAEAPLRNFFETIRNCSLEDLQTLYTATFDLNPLCSLEVGWHLFGENYERGEFLVKMRGELRRHGLAESGELPDHLSHAIALLGCMEQEDAASFAAACLFPALDKMRKAIEGKSNLFELVLLTVERLMELRYPRPELDNAESQPAFCILNSEV